MTKSPKLKWERKLGTVEHIVAEYRAKAGPITCLVFDYAHELQWFAETGYAHMEGYLTNLLEAQLAAESAAYAWLLEGVEAFGEPTIVNQTSISVGCQVTIEPTKTRSSTGHHPRTQHGPTI
jgi:hypothetical protein